MKSCSFTALLMASAGALIGPSVAAAQTPSTADGVIVTGSRVIRNGNAMPTAVTVVNAEELLQMRPGSIGEAISELPTLSGSRITTSNPGTGVTNSSANALNLRQLGYNRSLILFDGNRVPPTTYDQIVDTNVIPQMLLQRVDVVTGGVSAVYGSDAVSGVVNFITDRNFNGLRAEVTTGISELGDDHMWSAGIAAGARILNDKGHVEISFQHRDDPGILRRSSRDWGKGLWAMVGGGTAANPYHLASNVHFSNYAFGGLVTGATGTGAALNNQYFATNGVLSPFNAGAPSGTTNFAVGGDGAYHDGSAKAAIQSDQLFGRLDYDFDNNTHLYVEGVVNKNHVVNYGAYTMLNTLQFNGQNAFLPTAYQFTGTFRLSEFMSDRARTETNSQQAHHFVIVGLDGSLFSDWKWDVNYSHSQSSTTTANPNNIDSQKLFAALDATRDASGNVVCRVTVTNPGLYPGCVPLNVFGPTTASQAALDYIQQRTQYTALNRMDDVNASVTGSPFSTWAGPVSVAVSGEFRNQALTVESETQPADFANCAGLALNCTQNTTRRWFNATLAALPEVSNSVYEGALEADVPLIKDVPLFKEVTANAAYRYTNYDTSGAVSSWKLGLVWNVTDSLKLRGTRSRDIRAPTLYDLYQPSSVNNNATVTDLLTNVTGISTVYTGGNPNLVPEIAKTWTGGIVFSPSFIPGFSASVDGYYIDIGQAIISFNPTLPGQTNCYQSGGTSLICTLIQRPFPITNTTPANTATAWYNATLNISNFITYGADFDVSWRGRVFDNPLSVRTLVTWQPHVVTKTPGQAQQDNAGGAQVSLGGGPAWPQPKLRANVLLNYTVGPLDAGMQVRWRDKMWYQPASLNVFAPKTGLYAKTYVDFNLRYRMKPEHFGDVDLTFAVHNLLDAKPEPFAGNAQIANHGLFGGFPLGDDAIGRYYNIGLRMRL